MKPSDIKVIGDGVLQPSDLTRLANPKLIEQRNAAAHEYWPKLAKIMIQPGYLIVLQNWERIFQFVVGKSVEESANEYSLDELIFC